MYIISHDPKLYDEEKEMRAASKSANLHEELGQIKYIFSDKTGTLTKNKMIFRTARIGQRVYGSAKLHEPTSQTFLDFNEQYKLPHMEHFHWEDEEMMEQLVTLSQIKSCDGKLIFPDQTWMNSPINIELAKSELFMFWLTVSLCHSVVPSPTEGEQDPRGKFIGTFYEWQ